MKTIRTILLALKESTEASILNLDDINFSKESLDNLSLLARWITSNKNLTQISLQRSNLGLAKVDDLREFFCAIQQHPKLSSLTATDAGIRIENTELMHNFANCLAKSRIQELELDHNQLNEQFLTKILNENKNLKILSISSIGLGNWSETAIIALCNAIIDSTLKSLIMSQNALGRLNCLSMLGDAISRSHDLTTLSVEDNGIGENENAEDFLTKISGLKYLYLSHNSLVNIGPEGWELFISALISKPQIIELDISSNELGLMEEFLLREKGQIFLSYMSKLKEEIPDIKLDLSDNNLMKLDLLVNAVVITVKFLPPEEKAQLRPKLERAFRDPTPPPSASQLFVPVK